MPDEPEADPWTVDHIGTNSIAAVTNDPTGKVVDFKPSVLPLVPPTVYPPVSMLDFQPFFDELATDLPRYQRRRAAERAAAAAAAASSSTPSSLLLHSVPPLFFRPDFTLENPSTFDAVLGGDDRDGSFASPLVQEQLTGYLDHVEGEIVEQISHQSDKFFEAVGQMEEVNNAVRDACTNIEDLRLRTKSLRDEFYCRPHSVIRSHQKRRNLEAVYEKVKLIFEMRETEAAVRQLVEGREYMPSLELIQSAEHTLRTELVGVKAAYGVAIQMRELVRISHFFWPVYFISDALLGSRARWSAACRASSSASWPCSQSRTGSKSRQHRLDL